MKRTQKFTSLFLSIVIAVVLVSSLTVGVAFAADEPAQAQTRVFNDSLDRMLDDVTGTDTTPAYRAISWEAGRCDDFNDPILKIASPKISAGFDTLEIELRSVDGSITLADLKIALRVKDDDSVIAANTYALNDNVIAGAIDGTIGADWSTLSFDFTQSDIQVDGKAFDTTQPDAMLGFHLFADSTKGGKIDIRKVSVTKSGAETVVDNFDSVQTEWWKGTDAGCFIDTPRCYSITSSKEIKSTVETSNNIDEAYSAIVLTIAGSGNVSLAPIAEDGTVGNAVAWADLKDLNGTSVAALDANYRNAVISLNSLGATKIQGVKVIVSEGEVSVAKAFFTNMETVVPDKFFPTIDTNSIKYLSQFNFNYVPGDDYNKATEDCAPFNCDYILSYSVEKPAITDGHVVLTDKGNAYSNIKIRSKVASEGRQYLVIKYALQNGSTLNDFRFALVKSDPDVNTAIVYANQLQAGVYLPSLSEKNPYSDGAYNYLVVDIQKSFGLTESVSGIDMYFSGAGEILVDEIFYADSVKPALDVENKHVFDAYEEMPAEPTYWWTDFSDASKLSVVDGALKIEVPASTAICVGGAKPDNNKDFGCKYMVIRMKSDNLDMSTFRITWLDGSTSYANADGFKTIDGKEFVLTGEYQDFVIDLEASGIDKAIEGFRLWLGGWNAEAGTLYIDEIYFVDLAVAQEQTYSANASVTAGEGYHYLCGGDFVNSKDSRYLQLDLTALNTFKFDEFRLEIQFKSGSDPRFMYSNQGVMLANGTEFKVADAAVLGEGETASELKQSFVFDLDALGIDYTDIKAVHAHMTNANVNSDVKVDVKYFDYVAGLSTVNIPRNDDTNPVLNVTIDGADSKVGDEITIAATATDNYDGGVTIVYEVTLNGETIEVVNGKFTATKEGVYNVKVTAIDANDNKATFAQSVTVTAAAQDETPADNGVKNDDTGLGAGAIAGIVVGCLAAVAIIAVVAVFVSKKKKK